MDEKLIQLFFTQVYNLLNYTMNIAIPQILFETLQSAFLAEGKRFCTDAAKILKIPEKELQTKMFKDKKIHISLFKDSERPLSCLVPVQKGIVISRCRYPCVLGTSRCMVHQFVENIQEPSCNLKEYTRVESHPSLKEPLWCHEETGILINTAGQEVGQYVDEEIHLWTFDIGDNEF